MCPRWGANIYYNEKTFVRRFGYLSWKMLEALDEFVNNENIEQETQHYSLESTTTRFLLRIYQAIVDAVHSP